MLNICALAGLSFVSSFVSVKSELLLLLLLFLGWNACLSTPHDLQLSMQFLDSFSLRCLDKIAEKYLLWSSRLSVEPFVLWKS